MRKKFGYFRLFAGLFCLTVLGGCASGEKSPAESEPPAEDTQADFDMAKGSYKPSDLVIPRQEVYEYPELGMSVSLPESLMERMDKKEVAMLSMGDVTEDGMAVNYGLLCWKSMTEEQREMEVDSNETAFYDWMDSLAPAGAIGVYRQEAVEQLDMLTGCTEHKEIGKSKDGDYTYYLSVSPDAGQEVQDEMNQITWELTEMVSLGEAPGGEGSAAVNGEGTGEFSMQDVEGQVYTQEMFADYDLTMVNVFTTWCTPCINEIPDLEKLKNEMEDKKVNVVGIVLDALDSTGGTDEEAIEKAKILAERAGVTYPFLIPDEGYLNGRLAGINAVPETFFVDKDGNFVGETYSGSHSFDDWKSIVETILGEAVK